MTMQRGRMTPIAKPRWALRLAATALVGASVLVLGPTPSDRPVVRLAASAAGIRATPARIPAVGEAATPFAKLKVLSRPALQGQGVFSTGPTTTTTAVSVPTSQQPVGDVSPEVAGAAALARISYDWRQTGYTISFFGPRPGLYGRTGNGIKRIEIFVRPDETPDFLAHVVAHEIGHAVDLSFNNAARRAQWLALRGINPQASWFTCSGCHDFDTPAGDFAETFAYWQVGPAVYRSEMGPAPSAEALLQLRPLFNP